MLAQSVYSANYVSYCQCLLQDYTSCSSNSSYSSNNNNCSSSENSSNNSNYINNNSCNINSKSELTYPHVYYPLQQQPHSKAHDPSHRHPWLW